MRIAICDDDKLQLQHIQSELTQLLRDKRITAEVSLFSDADALIDSIHAQKADIILLDIMMPLVNGMDAAKEIRCFDQRAIIVFLTSSPEFAVESYDVKASGYLLKPISREKFRRVLEECLSAVGSTPEVLVLHTAFGYKCVPLQSIECAEAQNKTVRLTQTGGIIDNVSESFTGLEQHLCLQKGFFKCHRSYIVNMAYVDCFTTKEVVLRSGTVASIARGSYKPFHDAYFHFMFSEERK